MKETFFILSMLFCSIVVKAQDDNEFYRHKPILITVSGGMTLNMARGTMNEWNRGFDDIKGISKDHKRIGYVGQINIQKQFSPYYYFKTGLGYINKTLNPQMGKEGLTTPDSLKLGYLQIPFLFGQNLLPFDKGNFNFAIEAGVVGNIKLSDNSNILAARKANTKSFVLGLTAGADASYKISSTLRLNLHYTIMQDVTPAQNQWVTDAGESKKYSYKLQSHLIQIGVIYKIPKKPAQP